MLDIHRRSGKKLEAAVAYAFNAKKYEDGGFLIDEETRLPIDIEELRNAFNEYSDLIHFFQNVESGLISISLTEYTLLPSALTSAWMVYKNAVNAQKQKIKEANERERPRT